MTEQARVYVDRARDDVLVGWVNESKGKRTQSHLFDYQRDGQAGWKITGWTRKYYDDLGEVTYESKAKVTRRRLDPPIDDTVFEFQFPAGVKVREENDKTIMTYIAQEDGTLRLTDTRKRTDADRDKIVLELVTEDSSQTDAEREDVEPTQNTPPSIDSTEPEFHVEIRLHDETTDQPTTPWSTLRGRFVYEGDPPEPRPIEVTKDIKKLADKNLVDESLLVDKDGGIANVVVMYLPPVFEDENGRSREILDIHPDLAEGVADEVVLTAENGRFEPHVTSLWIGEQKLMFKNRDAVPYNINFSPLGDRASNPLILANDSHELSVARQQSVPVPVVCTVHPWVRAYVLPRNNPYVAVTAADGTFEIKNVPTGEQRFGVWHERAGWLDTSLLTRGVLKVSLMDATTQLPTFRIPGEAFESRVTGTFELAVPAEDNESPELEPVSDAP